MEWISVKERLPEPWFDVLVFVPGGGIENNFEVCYVDENNEWDMYDEMYGKVTHWMPLPDPPSGAERSGE